MRNIRQQIIIVTTAFVVGLSGYMSVVYAGTTKGWFFTSLCLFGTVLLALHLFKPEYEEFFLSSIAKREKKNAVPGQTHEIVHERAGHKCQNCASENGTHIYHIDREKAHNEPENLIILCKKCRELALEGTLTRSELYFMRLKKK